MVAAENKFLISKEEFDKLARVRDFNCVSIYVSLSKIKDGKFDDISFLEALALLKERLSKNEFSKNVLENILLPIESLTKRESIWKLTEEVPAKTLVVFANENGLKYFFLSKQIKTHSHFSSQYYLLPLFQKASKTEIKRDFFDVSPIVSQEGLVSSRLDKILSKAFDKEVKTVCIASDYEVYGAYDHENKTTFIEQEKTIKNSSLINLVALETYLSGGKVLLASLNKMPVKGVFLQAIFKNHK